MSPALPNGLRPRAGFTDVARIVDRIAHQIIERPPRPPPTSCCWAFRPAASRWLAGWPSGSRSSAAIAPAVGALDTTLYRDDLRLRGVRPLAETIEPPGGISRQAGDPGRRRALLGPHDPGRARRPQRAGSPPGRPAGRPGRSRPSRAADPGGLRRKEPAHLARPEGAGPLAETDGADAVYLLPTGPAPMITHLLSAGDLDRDDALQILDTAEQLDRGARRPRGQEAAAAARADRRQPLLRGLDPYPDLLRAGGQAAVGRRRHLQRQGLERLQGRVAQGHRADPGGDGRRRRGGPALLLGRGAPARHLGARQGDQRRRRHPRASDPGAARRLHDAPPLGGGTGDSTGCGS